MILPESFTRYTRTLMGDSLYTVFEKALSEEPPVSIRVNPAKRGTPPDAAEQVPWCPYGYYLAGRPAFTFDPLLHAGHYYVQEASSMFLHRVLARHVRKPVNMLDMCAAPGGKSTAAIAALPAGSMLTANEPVRARAQILSENIQKWGSPNIIVTNNYPADYARSGLMFDVVLCDVPCSGEGMFRKDSNAIGEWSTQNVENCRVLQRGIVSAAWQCLRPGGLLIYSTCTFNTKENEENVEWICSELGATPLETDTEGCPGITGQLTAGTSLPVCRFIPGRTKGEGLFMAVLSKNGECDAVTAKNARKKKAREPKGATAPYRNWLNSPEQFTFFHDGNRITAMPAATEELYTAASQRLRVIQAGVTVGHIKGRDIVPDQSLALSTALNRNAFPAAELDYGQAVSYLRKEPVPLDGNTPRGFVLMTYRGAPLGFEKNLGNRANNLYPQEWKIKSQHIPERTDVI